VIYLYAYTNHKENLDSLRRVKVIYEALKKEGIESEILINEYRAQLLARDWGLPLATTIETIKDIDAVAGINDIILIDSPEKLEGKVLNYPKNFKGVVYLNSSCKNIEFKGAKVINIFNDNSYIFTECKKEQKNVKTLFIYGDSDYDKFLINNLDKFKGKNIDLYWGIYFFVKYEDKFKEVFETIVESEEYYSAICKYKNIITTSMQVAIEARANGAKVYLLNNNLNNCLVKIAKQNNINLIEKDMNLSKVLNIDINIINSFKETIDIIKDYM